MVALGITVLIGTFAGCTTPPTTFPQTENPEITTVEDFDNLATSVNELKDKRIKIAGQSVRVEENDEGLLVFAEWLPYPSDDLHFTETPQSQPNLSKPTKKRRFTFLYPGAKNVDPSLTWKGNKFILLADIKGQKKIPVTLAGRSASVPHFEANCIRVWKTGGSEIGHAPDSQLSAYPPLARTFCVK
jgi:hypothetical protein